MVPDTDKTASVNKRMIPAYYLLICIIVFIILVAGAYFLGMMSVSTPADIGSSLIIVAASTGGIVVGLLLGVLVGRRR